MPARNLPSVVKFETATVQRIFLVLMVIFFGMAILGLVGELRGWWNDVGELMMTVGTIGGLLVGAAALSTGASEQQLDTVHSAVVDNGQTLETMDTKLDKLDKLDDLDKVQLELDKQTGVLDRQLAVLTEVRDRL